MPGNLLRSPGVISRSDIFFHPDYTVGTGISPVRLPKQFADFTASGESHPALKTKYVVKSRYHLFPAFATILSRKDHSAKKPAPEGAGLMFGGSLPASFPTGSKSMKSFVCFTNNRIAAECVFFMYNL